MKFLYTLLFLFLWFFSLGQNLVLNGSFEDTLSCPNGYGQINKAIGWSTQSYGTPDYFNSCNNGNVSVPLNAAGTCYPVTGQAYSGINLFGVYPGMSSNFREFITGNLVNPLQQNELYCVKFYIQLAQLSDYSCNNVGVYFGPTTSFFSNYEPLPYSPQLQNDPANTLTGYEWHLVSGIYKALGNEQYITIGNFLNNSMSDTTFIKIGASGATFYDAYYYVDDVSLVHINTGAGIDMAICKGESIRLGRESDSLITSYTWEPSIGLSDTSVAQPIATPTQTTTYIQTATLEGGCSKVDTVVVTVVDIEAGNDTSICESETITIGKGDSIPGVQYNWSPSYGIADAESAKTFATSTSTTNYILTASSNGCILKDTITVEVLPYKVPVGEAGNDQIICKGDSIRIGNGELNFNYSWQPNDGISNATIALPYVSPLNSTTYYLTVDLKFQYQCSRSFKDSVLVTVDPCIPPISIPNIITPNNDGRNDNFIIVGLQPKSHLTVYNRWGKIIFDNMNYDNTWKAEETVDGIYFYVLRIYDGKEYKGFVQVLR